MTQGKAILRVAIPSPLHGSFDYLPPPECNPAQLQPGIRLRLPFGRNQVVGILLEVASSSEVDEAKLRPALEILDSSPLLAPEQMKLLRWASHYYHHPLGEVLATGLPTLLRQGEPAEARHRSLWKITPEGREIDTTPLEKRAKRQAELMLRLRAAPAGLAAEQLSHVESVKSPRNWGDAMAALVKKGWVTLEQIPSLTMPSPPLKKGTQRAGIKGQGGFNDADSAPQNPPHSPFAKGGGDSVVLNDQQQQAINRVLHHQHEFAAFLLDGVTGSGKTEVYLRIINEVLAAGRQTLVLVPEITLTPQLIERFQRRFNEPIAVLHSGLNDRDRLNAWLYAASGDARIIIGTRSAIFTPMKTPGLIIVDEEHDASFKQQTGFRYSARDLAMVRAQQQNIPIVLGSATPSFESLLNLRQGRYHHLSLPQRAGSAKPPKVELLDVRGQPMEDQLSAQLLGQIRRHLGAGNQVLLFLNRRGFSPTIICHECGWIAECKRCDSHMTLHQKKRLFCCHHCGSQRPVAHQCPSCGSADLRPIGSGTERIEETLQQRLPDTPITRIDRDSTRLKGSLEAKLEEIHDGTPRLLIGTQMLAKGHHFPNVTLVGILDGDQGLFGIDFRASERMAQLIVQVAGRAGRAEKPGIVLIQTHHPDNPLLQLLCQQGYHAFAEAALSEREVTALPPYTYMALLRAEANHSIPTEQFLNHARELAQSIGIEGVELYGPMPSVMERRAGKYRYQLLLQSNQRQTLHRLLDQWTTRLSTLPEARKVRWSLDVDPVDLI